MVRLPGEPELASVSDAYNRVQFIGAADSVTAVVVCRGPADRPAPVPPCVPARRRPDLVCKVRRRPDRFRRPWNNLRSSHHKNTRFDAGQPSSVGQQHPEQPDAQ